MRTEKALKNMITSFMAYLFLFGVGILVRRLLLDSFDIELVAYDGLIHEVFSYITLADLGMDTLFTYRLYKAFADNDSKRLVKLVSMYRMMFLVLGFVVLGACGVLFFLLPKIFSSKVTYWYYFNIMFVLYGIQTVCSYLFGYWRPVLSAAQMEYKAVRIETVMSFLAIVVKVFVLLSTRDYILYLCLTIGCTILSYILVTVYAKKEFRNIKLSGVSFNDFKEEGMMSECKEIIAIKVGSTVTWSSSNLLITLLINTSMAAYYFNYAMIGSTLYDAVMKLINPMTASIADMVYKDDKKASYDFYQLVDVAFFFLASIVLCGFVCCFQGAISMFFGEKYLLPILFVMVYGIEYYVVTRSDLVRCFRSCFGDFHVERKYTIIGAIAGILTSILLARPFGIAGVVSGIIISVVFTWQGRFEIVFKNFFGKSIFRAWIKEIKLFAIALVEMLIAYFLTRNFTHSFLNLILCGVISVTVPMIINTIIFIRNESFIALISFVKIIFMNFLNKKRARDE